MKTLILDFDGTIADTRESILKTIQATLQELGVKAVDEKEIEKRIGLPLKDTFVEVAGLEGDILELAIRIYRKKYNDICFNCVTLFPGVEKVLRELYNENKIITVASSKGKDSLIKLLHNLGISELVSLVFGEQDVEHKKPAPDMAKLIMKQTDSLPNETMVVGDTIYDIGMGQAAGCVTCAVTYGNNTLEELKEQCPDYIVNDFEEILDIFRKI